MLLLEGSQVCLEPGFRKRSFLLLFFLAAYYLVVNITLQEATKKAKEQASERVKCLEEDLGRLR